MRQKALLHKCAIVIIVNEKKFLVQKRQESKDIHPGKWDIGMGETVRSGESFEAAAIRGLAEEFGITGVSKIQLMRGTNFALKYRSEQDNANYKAYELLHSRNVNPQPEEIDEIKFLVAEDVKKIISAGQFTPTGEIAFNKYLETKNEHALR